MKAHELICIVSGQITELPDTNTQCVNVGNYTAILSQAARRAIHLPLSRKQALRHAAQRQALFEALMRKGTVLVAKPQQWLSVSQAESCLKANANTFDALCQKLDGMCQFQVTVSWSEADVLSHFKAAPELSEVFASGNTTEAILTASIARLKARLSSQIRQMLEPAVADLIALPTVEGMLSNTVVLIRSEDEARLDTCVEAIDAIWSEGFSIRQIGPSAAGSFALLDLTWVSADDIAEAHRTLSLNLDAPREARVVARRAALMRPDVEPARIKKAAQTIEAFVPGTEDGFHLVHVISEQSSVSGAELSEVA